MMMPPIDGPMIRLAFTIDELSAMAFGRSARSSTISTTNDWRAGVSKALMIPCTTCRRSTCVTVITPPSVSTASATDCSIESTCVTTRIRCRFERSTRTPANGARIRVGICPQNPTTPRSNAEPVSRYTSQLVAMRVIHVPTRETLWPPKKRRKLRDARARVSRGRSRSCIASAAPTQRSADAWKVMITAVW